jgi:hypothetical protein
MPRQTESVPHRACLDLFSLEIFQASQRNRQKAVLAIALPERIIPDTKRKGTLPVWSSAKQTIGAMHLILFSCSMSGNLKVELQPETAIRARWS